MVTGPGEGGLALRILHISSDYPFTPLYKQLLMHFATDSGQQHTMYVPVAAGATIPRKYDYTGTNVGLIYSPDFQGLDRLFYQRKRQRITAAIERQVPMIDVSLVHAHYLFSAGGVAYALKRKFGTQYLVAIRSTDLNVFFKYALHLRRFGLQILQEAAGIVFLSPAYREALLSRYIPPQLRDSIRSKSIVLPNGISDYWLENCFYRKPRVAGNRDVHIAYVGAFTRNKNVATSLRVVQELKRRNYNVTMSLVGDGPDAVRLRKQAEALGSAVTFRPWTESQNELLAVYRSADLFMMPSIEETFGLVYAEALSQGLPVIYSHGQGIDGYFADGAVGHACSPRDPFGIADRVEDILRNYDRISATCTQSARVFSWHRIASEYENMYRAISQRNG